MILGYNLFFFAREGTKIVSYGKSGTINSEVISAGESIRIFARIDTADFVPPIYPAVRDTILTINDTAAVIINESGETINRWSQYFFSPTQPGTRVPIEFQHNGSVVRTSIITRLPDLGTYLSIILLQVIRALISILFVLVGFWAFMKRMDSSGVRVLAMFCYSMSVFFIFTVQALSDRYASFEIPLDIMFQNILQYLIPFFGGFWLNLQLLFPQPKRLIREKPFLAYLLCYAPMALMLLLIHSNNPYISVRTINLIGTFVIIPGQIFAGFFILNHSYRTTTNSLEKRQAHLVLWGSGIGLVSLLILILIATMFGDRFSTWKWQLVVLNLGFVAMLLAPLSFAYAFQRFRLLEVEGKLKRGTRYVLATGLLLAIFIGFMYLVGEIAMRQLGINSRTPTIIASLALAIGLSPALRRMRVLMESKFYPERYRLREMSHDFLQQAMTIANCNLLWQTVEQRLKETLNVQSVFPILRDESRENFVLLKEERNATPFRVQDHFTRLLMNQPRCLMVDEAIVSEEVILSLEEELWLLKNRIILILPMRTQSELIGILGLGAKTDGEDYTHEECNILAELSAQLALATENIRLLEENIEKRRMEEELAIARSIQQGFLPRQIPDTPGLKVVAKSVFCYEVAGDYYDVISIDKSSTVIAVGDVAGKGAGAALLMANLQASMRTAAAIGVRSKMGEVVSRINNLIFHNTSPDQYITFFAGYYKRKNSLLTYVNAGHNPPLLVRKGEVTLQLDKGGLILGCLEDMEYEHGEVKLKPDDLLVLFTDGVSEAMNDAEEEFGVERIEKYVTTNANKPVEEILSGLENEILTFCGDKPLLDDFTLMLVRVEE